MASSTAEDGIAAVKGGDNARGREMLRAAVWEDPENVQAWLWLAYAAESDRERLDAITHVLRLDPANKSAAAGLAHLVARGRVDVRVREPASPVPSRVEPAQSTAATAISDEAAETIVFDTRPSFIPIFYYGLIATVIVATTAVVLDGFSGPILGRGFTNLVTVVLGLSILAALAYGLLDRYYTNYTFTTSRLIVKRGILSRERRTIPIRRIQDVAYRQSLIERLFGIGDVLVESAGEVGQVRLRDLADCTYRTEQILVELDALREDPRLSAA